MIRAGVIAALASVAGGCLIADPGPYDAGSGTVCYEDSECTPNDCCGRGTAIVHVSDPGVPDCRAVKCDGKCPVNGIKCGCAVPVCRHSRCTSAIDGAPQNAAPTQPTSGSMAYVAGTINGWGHGDSTDGAFRWFHSSRGGYVYGGLYAQVATSNSSVSYSNLAVVDCVGADAPKVVGQKVRISVKLRFRCNTSGVATGIDIKVIDFTAASAEVIKFEASGTGTGNGLHLMATTTNWSESFSFETDYTIPSPAGDRTFILQIRRWGAIAISAQGSMTVDGV